MARRKRPSKPFPFLSLPPEIRSMIYEYVVKWNNSWITLRTNEDDGKGYRRKMFRSAIYRVSRQVRAESLCMLLCRTNIKVTTLGLAVRFFEDIGPSIINLTSLTVVAWGDKRDITHMYGTDWQRQSFFRSLNKAHNLKYLIVHFISFGRSRRKMFRQFAEYIAGMPNLQFSWSFTRRCIQRQDKFVRDGVAAAIEAFGEETQIWEREYVPFRT